MRSLRTAIVGMGKMGLLHASLLNVLPNVQMVAFCEKSFMMRRLLKKVFKRARVVGDLGKLSRLDLDFVYVTTPIPSHFPIIKDIYTNGITENMFVEKTLAASYDQATELCTLAERFGGTNMVGYPRRFGVTYKKAKEMMLEGTIGDEFSFHAYAYSSDFLDTSELSKAAQSRGGVLWDLGCHALDLAVWFFGDLNVDRVKQYGLADEFPKSSTNFSVKTLAGQKGEFNISWSMKGYRMPEIGLSIAGSDGNIIVSDDRLELKQKGRSRIWHRQNLDDNVDFWLGGPEYFREDEYFVKSVLKEDQAEPNFFAASKIDQIINEVQGCTD